MTWGKVVLALSIVGHGQGVRGGCYFVRSTTETFGRLRMVHSCRVGKEPSMYKNVQVSVCHEWRGP